MTGLIVWASRILVLYVIIRIAYSLFIKKRSPQGQKKQETAQRFDAQGKKIEDAEFKEL
ncbi:MAG TPA: hypothetical protein VLX68_17815 [Chitinivibrionales bacterium]|nr:hypothetical protein [Chitinivibrionales bacterium]